ncbi:MAG: lysozyme M1 (1,4-beta-N-acetylmuramidase) [Actinobacteria bacterium]|nr:lysozyme M1 (1,4-beta-N-acetylmuramidase) [Actinomycetota bacterium]
MGDNSSSIRRLTALSLASLLAALLPQTSSFGATRSTFFAVQTPSVGEPLLSFHGVVSPATGGATVRILQRVSDRWEPTGISAKTTDLGTWKVRGSFPSVESEVGFRAEIITSNNSFTTTARKLMINPVANPEDPNFSLISRSGPGSRIYGADVSRWQHPKDKAINFQKMFRAGMRFVMIKASDTRDDSDALARKYLVMDRHAAQAAGLYTGFYHYATLPNTESKKVIIADAKAQAQQAVWRLASVGGYTELDLPYALDLENNCIRYVNKRCAKFSSKRANTLWAETWLDTVYQKTGRKPFLYSYPAFLERALNRSPKLRTYPLWLSHFGINPAKPSAEPGKKVVGCFVHSWTTSDCKSLWQIWQFSSCGIAPKYGVPGSRLDLNVYRGDVTSFLKLTQGKWEPLEGELLPFNETTSITVSQVLATTTDKKVRITAEVKRINGEPVVTGSVEFALATIEDSATTFTFEQATIRDASGLFSLSIKGLPAGSYSGEVVFKDPTKTHASISAPVSFSLLQGAEMTPRPKPTKSAPVNPTLSGCRKQIKM